MEEGVPFGSGYFKRPVGILMVVNSVGNVSLYLIQPIKAFQNVRTHLDFRYRRFNPETCRMYIHAQNIITRHR